MSGFIDGLLRKATGRPTHKQLTAARVEFDCLILEQPPQDWELIRRRIQERQLQSSFDKGDLALIAENAILWYDRIRRDARDERVLANTPQREADDQSPPGSPPRVRRSAARANPAGQARSASPECPSPSLQPPPESARLDAEVYLATLHEVLAERTKRVIRCGKPGLAG